MKNGGVLVKPKDEENSLILEALIETINAEQTDEVTDAFMKLVGMICDEPETDRTLKELDNF